MNYPNPNQPLSQLQPPSKKPFPIALVVLGIVSLLLALAIIGGIHAFKSVTQGSSEAIAAGNRFVDSMGQHNYQAAESMFTPQTQARTPAGSLKDVETLVEKHHGAYVSHGEPQWSIQNWNGQTSVRLTYMVKFAKGDNTVSMTLVQTDKSYQVYDAHYDF